MWSDWAGPTLLCVHIWCAACRLWPAPVSRASHSPAAANQRAESGGSDQWEIMSLAQISGGSVKKMLIVPKMQPQSLCEFIKSFNGIRFVVYKWRKEFPTFSVSRDQLERAWTRDHTRHWPDEALLRERREAATSIRAVSRFPCDDKLFAKTEGFFWGVLNFFSVSQ